jgi:hypothetical protein
MTTAELLSYLRTLDVRIWLDDERIRYSAPGGVVSSDLRNQLVEHKAEIIELLRQAKTAVQSSSTIKPRLREGDRPVSFSQQRLWFLDRMQPGSPLYNIPVGLRLTGRLNAIGLEQCFDEIVRRHLILRTTFANRNGKPTQIVRSRLTLTLPLVDLRSIPESRRTVKAQQLASDEAIRPFDLEHGPLLRVTFIRLDSEEYLGLLTMHHIVSDGWSAAILVRELGALYRCFCDGRESDLAELSVQYLDFAAWQRERIQGEILERQMSYWKERLAGAPPALDLPTDHPRPALRSHNGARQSLSVRKDIAEAVKRLSQQEGATLFMAFLGIFNALLYRYTGQEDIVVGVPIAGRNRVEIENLIGFFVNTLVLRVRLSDNPTFRELLKRVKEATLGAYANQEVPFEKLVEELQPRRNLSLSPLFQVMFVHQGRTFQQLELPGLSLSAFSGGREEENFLAPPF